MRITPRVNSDIFAIDTLLQAVSDNHADTACCFNMNKRKYYYNRELN